MAARGGVPAFNERGAGDPRFGPGFERATVARFAFERGEEAPSHALHGRRLAWQICREGCCQTNLDSQMIGADGIAVPGLFAAGEVAGFGGGGHHGGNTVEGTFLGGCIFSECNAVRSGAVA